MKNNQAKIEKIEKAIKWHQDNWPSIDKSFSEEEHIEKLENHSKNLSILKEELLNEKEA